mgnify:CR=1 FL=1
MSRLLPMHRARLVAVAAAALTLVTVRVAAAAPTRTAIVPAEDVDILTRLQALPADRIMVETDAPYLAPLPFRGKRNEPAFVTETARVLAQTRGVTDDEIARQTTENFFRLFNKVPRNLADAA